MSAVGTAGSRKKEILMQQIDARTTRPNFTYPFKIVKGLPVGEKGIVAEVAHLRELVIKMIDTDIESGRDLAAPPVPDGVIGPRFKRSIPAPPSPLRAKQSKDMEAEDTARQAAAAAQDDPELLELEAKYLHKTFSDDDVPYKGKGKGKRSKPDRYVVYAISWSVEQEEWVAEFALLDSSGFKWRYS